VQGRIIVIIITITKDTREPKPKGVSDICDVRMELVMVGRKD
jgi:hypothetical protein